MIYETERPVGRFSIEVELANERDVIRAESGDIPAEKVRKTTIRGVVDSGAPRLVIPESVAKQLGVDVSGSAKVRYADGRTAERSIARLVRLAYGGRESVF